MGWPAIIAAVGSVASSLSSSKSKKEGDKNDAALQRELVGLQGAEQRRSSKYELELQDYYQQKNIQRNRNARGKMFDKYSSLAQPADFKREDLVPAEAPGVPVYKPAVVAPATYKKPSLWQRLTKPSLDPLGIAGMGPRGSVDVPEHVVTEATVVREG